MARIKAHELVGATQLACGVLSASLVLQHENMSRSEQALVVLNGFRIQPATERIGGQQWNGWRTTRQVMSHSGEEPFHRVSQQNEDPRVWCAPRQQWSDPRIMQVPRRPLAGGHSLRSFEGSTVSNLVVGPERLCPEAVEEVKLLWAVGMHVHPGVVLEKGLPPTGPSLLRTHAHPSRGFPWAESFCEPVRSEAVVRPSASDPRPASPSPCCLHLRTHNSNVPPALHLHPYPRGMATLDLDLLVVGTPRSGTTLVQRLACAVEGVAIPPETHFLALHAPTMAGLQWPLNVHTLRTEIGKFAERPEVAGLSLDADAVIEMLGGTCRRVSDLFAALVRSVVGHADAVGEKTPEHLRWAPSLLRQWPNLVVVCVVRDPRAVVASNLDVPFGMSRVSLLAERWRADQQTLRRALNDVHGDRIVVLPYEEVVGRPSEASHRIGAALGRKVSIGDGRPQKPPLRMSWETWKGRAEGPVTTDRVRAWESRLTPFDVAVIESICQHEMALHGYQAHTAPPKWSRTDLARRLRFRTERWWTQREIESS